MIAPSAERSAPRRVLIIKPSSLGDVVSAVPVLRGLRRSFPDVHAAWLVAKGCTPLLDHDSDLDDCVIFDRALLGRAWRSPGALAALAQLLGRLHAGRYDWVIDLQGLLRSGLFAFATAAPLRAGFADAREAAERFYTRRVRVGPRHTVARNVALARELGIDARVEDMTLQVSPKGKAFADRIVRRHNLQEGFLICVPPARWAERTNSCMQGPS